MLTILHPRRPYFRLAQHRPVRSFLAARESFLRENAAKARFRIINSPFRISSTLQLINTFAARGEFKFLS